MQKIKPTTRTPSEGIEHRLGTELGLIFACCHLLRESAPLSFSEEQLRLLSRIERSAGSIRDLRAELPPASEKIEGPAPMEAAPPR